MDAFNVSRLEAWKTTGPLAGTDLISPVDFSESVLRRSECQAFSSRKPFLFHISLIRRILSRYSRIERSFVSYEIHREIIIQTKWRAKKLLPNLRYIYKYIYIFHNFKVPFSTFSRNFSRIFSRKTEEKAQSAALCANPTFSPERVGGEGFVLNRFNRVFLR